ncbi:multiple monosaccharide ABC transporter ATP-binding protein [Meiothermus granaticius]|uniref:Xylose import ATP-binding protein XylG n=1 Tax=Meiothermus granaticius NBRC 107808 TaxID=1227551 RepID=A0A399F5A9_9DEIN|nr:multiple monosaccharide ABC transporter ATP-binding protein [Meiothermus granaticius]RIH90836.1 Xylose import ATP-binding protein XylG [Meiothermus granaticius NBRC 107808]GEM88538.1 xylose ABC transporter ATP-binding protein [Meiothermus granaticius NBRC 107808]
MAQEPILSMRNISKSFPGVQALDNVNLTVYKSEIHAIVGENGAGKSTLMKVLSGVYPYGQYEGEIHFEGKLQRFEDIRDSEAQGIIIIHQELALVPMLSIAENIFLGHELAKAGIIDWHTAYVRAQELLNRVGLKELPSAIVGRLGIGKQQLVEIAKALAKRVRLLILDEPTASLNETDSEALLRLLLELKAHDITCILISHKLNEVMQVADRITILRDGTTIETLNCAETLVKEDHIIRGMVGRDIQHRYPQRRPKIGEVIFEVRNWRVYHEQYVDYEVIKGVSFNVRRGEIVGIAGLMGSGRTELAMSLFGHAYGRRINGQVFIDGREVNVSTIGDAIRHGLAYVTEDRKGWGLILEQEIRKNVTLANLPKVSQRGVIDENSEAKVAQGFRESLRIRCSSIEQFVVNLSGGNQQKVLLSKWLFTQPSLLILDEPTRGIDVGAKYDIYTIIDGLAAEGKGILLISSEMPELLGMCDRIYVMSEGQFVAELPRSEASQERIMHAIVSSVQS